MPGPRSNVSLAVAVGAAVAVAAGVSRLVPYDYRPLNFAAVGALALFAAARLGLVRGLLVTAAALAVSDGLLWVKNDFHADYLPHPEVYLGYLVYALLGRRFLSGTSHPAVVGGTALAGSAAFFLITNFASWLYQDAAYGYSPAGLGNCYLAGIPFFRGTITGDLAFTGLFFALDYALARATAPKAVAA